MAHAYRGKLTGLVTGPLTNLARALRAEPALPAMLSRLVIMGGMFDADGNDVGADWNIRVDPEAASEVFAAWTRQQRLPIVCSLNLTRKVAMTPDILARLTCAAGPSALTRVIQDAMRFYFESHRDRGFGYLAYLHDPLAAAIALDPQLVTTQVATVDVVLADIPTRGMTVADRSGKHPPTRGSGSASTRPCSSRGSSNESQRSRAERELAARLRPDFHTGVTLDAAKTGLRCHS